ncbi:helix-turn-helix domain-containing protein [Hazenella sp. IB182357]|uniref:Helix-turn-helix domain-containing protein n=1 Tax=Polycladospora coralii TaxID=2771432 RepID=A0A926NB59_9BACL|nr:helix-turn-helix transcriptional regulator [Polycladospora coralii]MBD1373656.1 helix-turn-helix domain-containing protein [Polycladospora coralii]
MSIEIGGRLRQARLKLGLEIEDIEAKTKIDKKHLIALENGQFDSLPSPIYVRSYLRSFANAVGENPQNLLRMIRMDVTGSFDVKRLNERVSNTNTKLLPARQTISYEPQVENLLKRDFRKIEGNSIETISNDTSSSVSMTVPSRQISKMETKRTKSQSNKDTLFGRFYNWILLIGFGTLVVAATLVGMYVYDTGKNEVVPKSTENIEAVEQEPLLTLLKSSPSGRTDYYELVFADQVELEIVSVDGGVAKVAFRKQEVGDILKEIEVSANQTYSQSFDHDVWVHIDQPANIKMTVNDVGTINTNYNQEKTIKITKQN